VPSALLLLLLPSHARSACIPCWWLVAGSWQIAMALGVLISFFAEFVYAVLGFGPSIALVSIGMASH
jgi:hypothetical protein